jgi:predicted transcriptional regulator
LSQFRVLLFIEKNPMASVNDIVLGLNMDKRLVQKKIARLLGYNFVRRRVKGGRFYYEKVW